jgi:probable F420-dependent oxidoreductase
VTRLPELGFYALAGEAEQPRQLVQEAADAEDLGLGHAFISERWSTKEAATISGALGAVSENLCIATAATNHGTRHPVITGAFALTMHRLTQGRFTLGLGRGVAAQFRAFGMPAVTTAQLEDFAGIMRKLFAAQPVANHHGPAGDYPSLSLGLAEPEAIPLGLVAFGNATLALGGRAFDQVVLHTFFTDETLRRCVQVVKDAAEQAGRDPGAVKVWSCLATVTDLLAPEQQLRKTVGRLATYLQAYGDLMVSVNRWDPEALQRFRADAVVQTYSEGGRMRVIDSPRTPVADLEHLATVLPAEWLDAAALGSPEHCAGVVRRQLDLGADGVIMHGAAPADLAPVVTAYRQAERAPLTSPADQAAPTTRS